MRGFFVKSTPPFWQNNVHRRFKIHLADEKLRIVRVALQLFDNPIVSVLRRVKGFRSSVQEIRQIRRHVDRPAIPLTFDHELGTG